MTLLLATPVRAAELATAHVSFGYADFRVELVKLMPDVAMLCGHVTFGLDVVRARNRIVGVLLSTPEFAPVTEVLWVDDDQWTEDVRIVPAMVEKCRGVLGAAYTNKKHPVRWVHRVDAEGQLRGVGFGFTMVTRACLEAVASTATWYVDLPGGQRCPDVFGQLYDETPQGLTLLSEDYSFCERARAAGFPVELCTGVGIMHAGGHAWSGKDMS